MSGPSAHGRGTVPPPSKPRRGGVKGSQARIAAVGALVALTLVFALVNLDRVRVNWVVTSSDTPLIVVIGVAFVLGAATGILLWRHRPQR